MASPLSVHIVTHTHWDREWYLPLERFRQRLVALIDELLDDPPADAESFLLDGQAIVAEDYLGLRPERRDDLTRLLTAGRLEAGPWYVLADELIPSGEALVRNLLAGRRALRALGAGSPPVLYCPDSFGHPATLPAIAIGFGLPMIVLWRGYGGPRWPPGDTARWVAPDTSEAILFHLPRDGYEFGSHLPADEESASGRWRRIRDELAPRSATGVVLVPHGADHHARQADHPKAIAALERAGRPDRVHRSSLARFARELIGKSKDADLPRVGGELRDSYGYTWTLQGTFGTRAAEKRLNAQTERLLLREAEPWAALAVRMNGRSRRAFVQNAWRSVLAAHPHDTLCGCSIDAVADAMELRLRSAAIESSGVRDDAITDLIGHDAAAARIRRDDWKPIVVVRNVAARPRTGVAIVDVREFVADVPVGPGSAGSSAPTTAPRTTPRLGGAGKVQVLERGLAYDRVESPRHYPDNDLVSTTTVATWVRDVHAYGLVSLPIGAAPSRDGPSEPVTVDHPEASEGSSSGRGSIHRMRNAHLTVHVGADGVVALQDREGRRADRVIDIRDEIDIGDLYTPAPRGRFGTPRFLGTRQLHRGPLRGELELRWHLEPEGSVNRSTTSILKAHLILDADAPFLRINVEGENRATDHRIRLALATGVSPATVIADAAFGPVRRERLAVPASDMVAEAPPPTAPLHRYVSLFGKSAGATVYSDGLAEYEASDDGTVLVTLVRAVGELSKNDLPERPGNAGWPTHTPGAQCIGPFEAAFAILLHGRHSSATVDEIDRTADDVLHPLTGSTIRSALTIPAPIRGVQLDGLGLSFSTLKESEDGAWVVARCVNLLDEPTSGRWTLAFPVQEARLARLDETPLDSIPVHRNTVEFQAGPRAIVTVLVN